MPGASFGVKSEVKIAELAMFMNESMFNGIKLLLSPCIRPQAGKVTD